MIYHHCVAKSCWLFSQKSSIVENRLGSKYASARAPFQLQKFSKYFNLVPRAIFKKIHLPLIGKRYVGKNKANQNVFEVYDLRE